MSTLYSVGGLVTNQVNDNNLTIGNRAISRCLSNLNCQSVGQLTLDLCCICIRTQSDDLVSCIETYYLNKKHPRQTSGVFQFTWNLAD